MDLIPQFILSNPLKDSTSLEKRINERIIFTMTTKEGLFEKGPHITIIQCITLYF